MIDWSFVQGEGRYVLEDMSDEQIQVYDMYEGHTVNEASNRCTSDHTPIS